MVNISVKKKKKTFSTLKSIVEVYVYGSCVNKPNKVSICFL